MRTRKRTRGWGGGFKGRIMALAHLASGALVYAQSGIVPTQLETVGQQILDAFTGDLARIILGCCFAGSCIAYAYNKDNEKMKAKILAVMVACVLLAVVPTVINTLIDL